MVDRILIWGATGQPNVFLHGESRLTYDHLLIKMGANTAKLHFEAPIVLSQEAYDLIIDTTAAPRLRSLDGIADLGHADQASRPLAKLRQDLANRKIKVGGSGGAFFGLPGAEGTWQGEISLQLPFLSSGDKRPAALTARAWFAVSADIDLDHFAVHADIAGRMEFEVSISGADILGKLSCLLPALPSVGISLGNLKLLDLTFDGLDLPSFPFLPIALSLPDWFGINTSVEWTDPTGTLTLDGEGNVAFAATASEANFFATVDGGSRFRIFQVSDFEATLTKGKLALNGNVNSDADIAINETIRFGGGRFPISGEIRLQKAEISLTGKKIDVLWTIPRLQLQVTDDPDTRIAVSLTLETTSDDGKLSWEVTDLKLLDLNASLDLRDVLTDTVGDLLRIVVLAGNTDNVLFDRIARIIAALARYFAVAGGAVSGFLSELAEQTGALIGDALQAMLALLKDAGDLVTIELRLDKTSLRPVQLILSPRANTTLNDFKLGGSVLSLSVNAKHTPAIAINFKHGWYGLVLLHEFDPSDKPGFTLGTNLWLSPDTGPASAIGELKEAPTEPLLQLKGQVNKNREIVLAAIQNGRGRFFQTFTGDRAVAIDLPNTNKISTVSELGPLKSLEFGEGDQGDIGLTVKYDGLKDKIVSMMPKGPPSGGSPLGDLTQRVCLNVPEDATVKIEKSRITIPIKAEIKVGGSGGAKDDLKVAADLKVLLDLQSLNVKLDGDEAFIETKESLLTFKAFGLQLAFAPADGKVLVLKFADGDFRLELAPDAKLQIRYNRISQSGPGLVLEATEFGIGRGGLDLHAGVTEEPVRLAGIDQPFRFTSGSLRIEGGKLVGGTLSGAGPVPPALVGEAVAEIDLVFGQRNGRFAVIAANAKLEKEGEPLYSTGTRFRLTIDALGLDYRDVGSGGQHFFFLLWGEAAFEPAADEFSKGILKNIRSVALKLDAVPLTGDARELLRHISFQVEINPPVRRTLFDIFRFELRGIGFHPASDKWDDRPPAIGLSGQISFVSAGDAIRSEIDVHMVWLTLPDTDSGSPLPRLRADGLSVLLQVGGVARVEATALAVDSSIPSIYTPVELPADVTADGFLAAGRLEIVGIGAYGGAMGFLELSKEGSDEKKHAMFLYGQAEKLAERIDTPIGPLWIREIGLGLGKNYTLSAIAAADQARSPREMVRELDKISKIQGNLSNFNAWTPQFDKDAITLALRGMISMTSMSPNSSSYNAEGEKELSNPLLMDIVMAIRTDLTFFVNVRAWIAQNYNDWFEARATAKWKEQPSLRGYLYFSVPRKELLARFISDPTGVIGKHPELPEPLVDAIQATRFSSTLYIRPGLFHTEFGWPYELGFDLGEKDGNFWLSVSGGLVFRIEDATALYGIAFRATGGLRFEGRVGSASFGASVTARAEFALGAKFIAFLAPLKPKDTLFYGEVYLNLTLSFGVSIWMSFKIFRKRFTIHIGFSIMLTISIAAEVVVAGTGIGAKVHAAVGVRGFGRTLSVGIGFSFGANQLASARARVARFMELGLGIDPPKGEALYAPAPAPEAARAARASNADTRLDAPAPPVVPVPPPVKNVVEPANRPDGKAIGKTDFWALLFDAGSKDGSKQYILQLVPRDHSDGQLGSDAATFFAEPRRIADPGQIHGDDINAVDYELIGTHKPSHYLTRNGSGRTQAQIKANLVQNVGESDAGNVILNSLLAECFLRGPDPANPLNLNPNSLSFGEPLPINFDPPKPQVAPRPGKAITDQAKRFFATGEAIDASLAAEERRSALINLIGESATKLAERARAPGFTEDDWKLSDDKPLDGRDFGLTFLIKREELDDLFHDKPNGPRPGKFTVKKRIWINDAGTWRWDMSNEGDVDLLLHPDDAFEEQQPTLYEPCVVPGDDGLQLCWDLEPSFGRSGANGLDFVEDPETHLAYYSIERSFEGTDVNWAHEFRSRTVTPISYTENDGGITATRSRAKMHLCDDLTMGGIPEDLRALILGVPIPSGRKPLEVWRSAIPDTRNVSVVYKITAVDQIGTRTSQRVLEYPLPTPVMQVEAPVSTELSVIYPDLPEFDMTADAPPEITLDLIFADDAGDLADTKTTDYRIRLRSVALRGGGQYGSDAVDDAKSRPSQLEIEQKRNDLDIDLRLTRVEASGNDTIPLVFLTSEQAASGDTGKRHNFRVTSQDINILTGKALLLKALKIQNKPEQPGDLRATRVFLQRLVKAGTDASLRPSLWSQAQTQLVVEVDADDALVAPEEKPGFSATVEMLEQPLRVNFPALQRTQLQRNAGRLELLYPSAGSTLTNLLKLHQNPVLRRLDPDRRSAIRLEINALGSQLGDAGHLKAEPVSGIVGGFDIFDVDPARLRVLGEDGKAPDKTVIVDEARRRGTLKVLPRSLSGLFPDAVSDFQTIEARYPSAARRTDPKARGLDAASTQSQRLRAPWYGRAETMAAFPMVRVRRGLIPQPEEHLISTILERKDIRRIQFGLTNANPPPDELPKNQEDEWEDIVKDIINLGVYLDPAVADPLKGEFGLNLPASNTGEVVAWRDTTDDISGLQAIDLRAIMRGLLLGENPIDLSALDQKFATWRRGGAPEALRGAFSVTVAISSFRATKTGEKLVGTELLNISLIPNLHAILDEAMDALVYAAYDAATGTHPGKVFRGYEVVREPQPPLQSDKFDAFLDAHAASADPYGWGALRALGLAAGFRLYEIEHDAYVTGEALLTRVNTVFQTAIARYVPVGGHTATDFSTALQSPANIGAPFVECIDLPEEYMAVSSFDGRSATQAEDASNILNGDLSILQISLRPRPAQQLHAAKQAPVQYFELRRNLVDKGQINLEKLRKDSPNYVVDLQAMNDLSDDTGIHRWTDDVTAKWLFDNQDVFKRTPFLDDEQLKDMTDGQKAAVLRVASVSGSPKWDDMTTRIETAFGGLVSINRIANPLTSETASEVFDLFPPLDGPVLAALQITHDGNAGITKPFDTLTPLLPPKHTPEDLTWPDTPIVEAKDNRQRQKAVARAEKHAEWTERFLLHGTGQATVDNAIPEPLFALVSLTAEETMARVPDANGVVRAFFIDPSQNGKEILFAVRPFGRYAWIDTQIANASGERVATLDKALDTNWQNHFVSVSLPRTRPPVKVPILAARRGTQADPGVLNEVELVIARTPDQIAGTANIPAERALQPGWTGLELRAAFPGAQRAKMLAKKDDFEWSGDFNLPSAEPMANDVLYGEVMTPQDLAATRAAVPDAWRGALRYGFKGLPHFLAITAMVHQSAGVVVSEVSALQLPEADFILRLPPFRDGSVSDPGDIRTATDWGRASAPTWQILREIADGKERVLVAIDLPLVRNLDLMANAELTAWTDGKPDRVTTIYRLPDAEVGYRISSMSTDLSSAVPQLEILPAALKDGDGIATPVNVAMVSGDRFVFADATTSPIGYDADCTTNKDIAKIWSWQQPVTALVSEASHVPFEYDLNFAQLAKDTGKFDVTPMGFDAVLWSQWTPKRQITFDISDNDQSADWKQAVQALIDWLTPFVGDPDVDVALVELEVIKDTVTGEELLSATIPMGSGVPPVLTDIPVTDTGPFTATPADPTDFSIRAKITEVIEAVYTDQTKLENAKTLLDYEGSRWRHQFQSGFGGTDAVYAPTTTTPATALPAPFAYFETRQYIFDDGTNLTDAMVQTLSDAAMAANTIDPYLAIRAFDVLANLRKLSVTVLAQVKTIDLPVPKGTGDIVAAGFAETKINDWRIGFHLPPQPDDLAKLTDAEVRTEITRLAATQVFGGAGNARMTAFRGDKPAVSVAIAPGKSNGGGP